MHTKRLIWRSGPVAGWRRASNPARTASRTTGQTSVMSSVVPDERAGGGSGAVFSCHKGDAAVTVVVDEPTVSALMRPASRGRVALTGANPSDPLDIDANFLGEQADVDALAGAVDVYRDLATSASLRPYSRREVFPATGGRADLERLIRATATTSWHQSGTNAMGRSGDAVVDGHLAVHGVAHLRVADASVMPRVTTGNTMAPCVVIGERASDILRAEHGIT